MPAPAYPRCLVADLPFQLAAPLAARLRSAADVEARLPRALQALGLPQDGDVVVFDDPDGWQAARLGDVGVRARSVPLAEPFQLDAPDAGLDAIVTCWSGFRGVDADALGEADRALRDEGSLFVVHDYGRDNVSALRPADAPEYASWSRRDGPFLRDGGFRIRVIHCFWTFATLAEARSFLGEAFGSPGVALGEALRRPRLSWNVAIYHRRRHGAASPGRRGTEA